MFTLRTFSILSVVYGLDSTTMVATLFYNHDTLRHEHVHTET